MPIPLNYQISEFDCGPVSLLNALNVLFDRKLIRPCLIKAIYGYSLDRVDTHGNPGNWGTSASAMRFLGEWINEYGRNCSFPVHCEPMQPADVWFGEGSPLVAALEKGAVAIVRCRLMVQHYVLITGAKDGWVDIWDPYHVEQSCFKKKTLRMVDDEPYHCNRRVAYSQINGEGKGYYHLGVPENRECMLIFNTANNSEEA